MSTKSQNCPLVRGLDESGSGTRSFGDDEGIELENINVQKREEKDESCVGLSSDEAYKRLCSIVKHELMAFNHANNLGWPYHFTKMLRSPGVCFNWISLALVLFQIFLLIFGFAFQERRKAMPLVEISIVIIITIFNIILGVQEERLKKTELSKKVTKFLSHCQTYRMECPWAESSYPDLATPCTDSLSLVWTYRKNRLVNVPANLLVEGDVIVLGPGQKCPAKVQQISPNSEKIFDVGEMFYPETEEQGENEEQEQIFPCRPRPRQTFRVVEAPLQQGLRRTFESSQKRPKSLLDNERHHITRQILQYRVIPAILGLSFLINILRIILSKEDFGSWSEMVFVLQAHVIIPLLPLMFPLMWVVVNCFGAARIHVLFRTNITQLSKNVSLPLSDVNYRFWEIFKGESGTLSRTANLLHTLGTISVLCCVNKDGILASPNPNAEKVFFFRKRKEKRHKRLLARTSQPDSVEDRANFFATNVVDDDEDSSTSPIVREDGLSQEGKEEIEHSGMPTPQLNQRDYTFISHFEVLNLSSDPQSEFGVVFDDIRWQRHLSSLKPLGLNVLLNAPCSSPDHAVKIADHLGHMSLLMNDVPVRVVRRCLCLLGRQIGFIDSALEGFKRKHNIFAFRHHINDPTVPSHSFLSICKEISVPFLTSLVVEHVASGLHQLLSQGSADLLLDVCTDFWDGSEVHPLTSLERKRIRDFYHRTSITSNCIALSYRPVTQSWKGSNQDVFLEIPESLEWTYSDSDNGSMSSTRSSDVSEEGGVKIGPSSPSIGANANDVDMDFYQRIIGGQIFIGMITLQHKAKQDIPPLVEDLDNAGIRFVYFSEENEIKSQVFAERLGLETGWNCHISFSEKTAGFDEHSTLTAGSEGKMEETADEYLVSHVTAAQEDHDVKDDESVRDDEGQSGEHEEHEVHLKDTNSEDVDTKSEDVDIEKKVKWRDSEARDRKSSEASSSSATTNNDEPDHGGDIWFQIGNRAKLPRGINNIRPHLECVDNVPLLVPLFTDCTPQAAREMISIMQEYGEVVCCIGSSLNVDNVEIFNQADISVALQPSFPKVCLSDTSRFRDSQTSNVVPTDASSQTNLIPHEIPHSSREEELNPLSVSSSLNGLSCSLSFHRDYNIKFVALLKEARRLCFGLRMCYTFMLSCQLTLCLIMLTASLFVLPPPLTGLHLLWFTCVLVPLLSLSLVNADNEPQLMATMTAKNDKNFKGYCSLFLRFHGLGFMLCVLVCDLLILPLTLMSFCEQFTSSPSQECHYLLGNRNISEPWNGFGDSHISGLALAQDVVAFFIVLCFVFMSTSYVHPLRQLWRRSPFSNKQWIVSTIVVIALQVIYMTISQLLWRHENNTDYHISRLPSSVLGLVFLCPVLHLGVCELIKRKYIKFYIRCQKRAKLKFGTKLGMNSPF